MTQEEIEEKIDQHKLWLSDQSKGQRAIFIKEDLRWANLGYVNLTKADFFGSDLRKADFSDADLGGANFTNANLRNANLRGTNLNSVNFRNANLYRAYLSGSNLNNGEFSSVNFLSLDLKGVDFTKIKDYETTYIYKDWTLILIKELVIWQKMIETNDKNLAILYKNTWMKEDCKKILRNYYK